MGIFMIFTILISQSGWGPEIVAVYRDSLPPPYGIGEPKIAVNGDTIHIVWWEPGGEILYTRSLDGGLTWENPRIISNPDSLDSEMCSICVNGNSVHVGWWESDTYSFQYRRSLNAGETWEPIRTLIPEDQCNGGVIGNKGDTLVMIANGSSYIYDKLWFRKSLDNGFLWSNPILINCWMGYPKVGVNPPFISVVGQRLDLNSQFEEIYYIRSTDLGNTWENDTMISEPWNDSGQWPDLYVDGSKLYVTWFDYKYTTHAWTGDIFLRISYDNGTTWEAIRETVSTSHLATQSAVCAFNNQIHIVWVEENEGTELYYRYGIKLGNGYKWSKIDRLTFAQGESINPDMTYSNNKLHVVWEDWRIEAPGIYYRYKTFLNCEEKINLNYDSYISFILTKNNLTLKFKNKKMKIFNPYGGLNEPNLKAGIYFIFLEKNYKIKFIKVR